MEQLAYKAGGEECRKAIIGGKGVGLILKTLTINYRVSESRVSFSISNWPFRSVLSFTLIR
jgi:hypothetical protein